VILGGSRAWLGPVVGGLLLTALPEVLRPVGDVRLVLFGLVIVLGPVLAPRGLVSPNCWSGWAAGALPPGSRSHEHRSA
jgi:branched-chain amino acid transport system permease protein